jgi:hypothetical protein
VTRREFIGLGLLLGCSEEEIIMNKKKKLLIYNALMGGSATPTPPNPIVDAFGNSLVYFLDPANLSTMYKEQAATGVPLTEVSADADTVGMIYDRGYHGYYATAESDATRPTLGSDATQKACITFSSAASTRLRVINSQSYLRKFSEASSAWCVATRIKKGASSNGTTGYILMSHQDSTANFGFRLSFFTDNKLYLWIVYGAGQRILIGFNQTIVEADGWVDVIVYTNGTAGTAIIGNTSQNFTLAGGATGNATNDMYIGSGASGVSPLKASLGYLVMLNRIPTAGEITLLKAYNPEKNTNTWIVPTQKYNFNNSLRGWADTGKTVQITNGVAIRAWEPEDATIFGPLNRDITTASAGVSPVWTTNLQNGKAGLVYDGTDDNAVFGSALFREDAGKGVLVVVARNLRALTGSHIFSGAGYMPFTGSTYPSGSLGLGNTYFLAHPVAGPGIGASLFKNLVEAANIAVFRRNGTTYDQWTGLKIRVNGSDSNQLEYSNMGTQNFAGWQLQGYVFKVEFYSGLKTNSEVEALIDAENTSYAI